MITAKRVELTQLWLNLQTQRVRGGFRIRHGVMRFVEAYGLSASLAEEHGEHRMGIPFVMFASIYLTIVVQSGPAQWAPH